MAKRCKPVMDAPEIIARCLSCTRIGCSGVCDSVPNIEHSNKKPTASKRHTWTPEELELLVDLHSQGLYDREIAEALGVSRSSISNKRRKFGLVSNYVMETGDWGELREN